MSKKVWVAGEALIDLISVAGSERKPMVGGGPANTAKAVARLGYPVSFIGGISSDCHGLSIDAELSESGVDLSLVLRTELPTALALATIDENGQANYDFRLSGTASFSFDGSWLPAGEADVIHVGSVATLLEPGATQLLKWASAKSSTVIFDPNVRSSILGDQAQYRAVVESWISVATIVKLSEDDIKWLYDAEEESVVGAWLSRGIELVVVTRAEKGLRAYRKGLKVEVPAVPVQLVDSVGAGDTIGAVLVEGVLTHGVCALTDTCLRSVLVRAAKAAAITCSREGANPPWREELDNA